MSEILKEPKPSEAALGAFWASDGGVVEALECVYAVDVAPLIAEVERLMNENARLTDENERLTKELSCRDALIKDHLGTIMHLENRVDAEAYRAEAAERQNAVLVEASWPSRGVQVIEVE